MKKFVFSLDTLLGVRKSEEKNVKNELAEARLKLRQLEEKLEEIEESTRAEHERFMQGSKGGFKAADLGAHYSYIETLRLEARKQEMLISTARKKCESILEKLIAIRKEIKMLEILKEQRYQEYLKEVQAEDLKMLDDFINSSLKRAEQVES